MALHSRLSETFVRRTPGVRIDRKKNSATSGRITRTYAELQERAADHSLLPIILR